MQQNKKKVFDWGLFGYSSAANSLASESEGLGDKSGSVGDDCREALQDH